jgi:capsular exopolysaccharide synthesis family protein
MGLILAVSAVFVKELLDDSILAPEGVRRLGVTLLGIVPRIRSTKSSAGNPNELLAIHTPSSRFATSIQHLVTRLDVLESGDCSVVLFTSPESGEGKTTIASNVAAGLATAGWRTLLLDANPWSPRLHLVTNSPLSPGLTDLLFGPALMKDCIHSTSISNLSVISAGGQRSGKFTLLASRDFDALMTYLKASFDRIVIDAAGLHSAGSSLGLTPLCDQLVVVARAGKTSDAELSECLAEMKELSVPGLAVVLNSFDSRLAFGSYSGRRFFGEYGKREGTRWWTWGDRVNQVHEELRFSADSTPGNLDDPSLQKSGSSVRRRRRRYRESIGAAGASPTREPVGTDFEPPLWEDSDV